MTKHFVSSDCRWVTWDAVFSQNSSSHVYSAKERRTRMEPFGERTIIFTTPSEVLIGKPIHCFELFHRHCRHSSKDCPIGKSRGDQSHIEFRADLYSLVIHRVHCDWHVSWFGWTRVDVSIIFGNEIDIVEDKTLPGVLFHRLTEANVEEKSSIERHIDELEEQRRTDMRSHRRGESYRLDEKDLIV